MSSSSSSSSSVSATTVNGTTRFSGLSSGIDVDGLVDKLMTAEKSKLNKMKQQQQVLEWKQEQYRTITSSVTTFVDKYLSTTSSDSLLKQSNFQQFAVTSSDSSVSAKATSNAVAGTHSIKVTQLATAATQSSDANITEAVTGSSAATFTSLKGTSFTITVDGTKRTVSFDDTFTSSDSSEVEGIAYVQAAIDEAVGSGKLKVSSTGGTDSTALTFSAVANSGAGSITVANADSDGSFSAMGYNTATSNLKNRMSVDDTLSVFSGKLADTSDASFFSSSGELEFTINGQKFSFDKDDSLDDVITAVNANDSANVTMKYDSNTDKLIVTANDTGAGNTLVMADVSGSFISSIMPTSTNYTAGVDAQVVLDGVSLTRSSNTFTQDGVTYTLNSTSTTAASVGITQDVDAIYDVINNFVTDYNTLIASINSKTSEEYDSDYQPLTDDQEDDMSDEEITKWNDKAQTGLLANDNTLSTMLSKMRSALMSSVSGVTEVLTSIGITTSTYSEQGKLHVDEDALKTAIASNPTDVMNLFTKSSSTYPGTATVRTYSSSERNVRTSEEGIAYRIYDVLQDYVGTIRDSGGNKGILLEKAGTENDTTDTDNSISDQLDTLADKIEDEEDRLDDVQDRYYNQFTAMETALEKLSSQSSIISSFSSGS